MCITIGSKCRILGLAGSFLCGAHCRFTHRMHAVIQTLAKHLDLGKGVQIPAGQQAAQIGNQFFEFALGGGGVRSSLTSLSLQ